MRVDHRSPNVFMSEKFLDRSDVITVLKEMSGEAMTQCVTASVLDDARISNRSFQRVLNGRVRDVVSALHAAARIQRAVSGRKYVLPTPVACGPRILSRQRVRQEYLATAVLQVLLVHYLHFREMAFQWLLQALRQHRNPILFSFPVANRYLSVSEVQILNPQAQTFHQSEAGTV